MHYGNFSITLAHPSYYYFLLFFLMTAMASTSILTTGMSFPMTMLMMRTLHIWIILKCFMLYILCTNLSVSLLVAAHLVEMLHFEETKRKLHKDIPSPKRTDFLSYQQFPILLFSWLFVSPYLPGSFPFQSGILPALPVFLPLPVSFLPVQPLPPMIGSPALLI